MCCERQRKLFFLMKMKPTYNTTEREGKTFFFFFFIFSPHRITLLLRISSRHDENRGATFVEHPKAVVSVSWKSQIIRIISPKSGIFLNYTIRGWSQPTYLRYCSRLLSCMCGEKKTEIVFACLVLTSCSPLVKKACHERQENT